MTKLDKSHLSLAGEYRVASELLKRGLNAKRQLDELITLSDLNEEADDE